MPLFSVKWFKPQGIPCHGDSTSHKGDPLIIPGEVVNVLHHVTVGSSPRDPRPQESRPRAFEAFFRRTTRGSSAPWRCLVTILVATPRLKKGHYPRGCTLPKTIILMRCKRRVIYFEARRRLRKPQRLFHVVGPRV